MATATQDIVTLVTSTPAIVLTDPKREEELLAHIRAEIAASVPDLTTVKGRKAIGALAFKISRTKTAIDDAGDEMVDEARAVVTKINGDRGRIRKLLEGLRDEARKPLDDWETAEALRAQKVADMANRLRAAALVPLGMKADAVEKRLAEIEAIVFDPEVFTDEVTPLLRGSVVSALKASIEQLKAAEAEKAELEVLRKDAVAKEAAEAKAAKAAEATKAAEASAAAKPPADETKPPEERPARTGEALPDVERRQRAFAAAMVALINLELPKTQAMKVVLAILARQIPHVTLTF